MTTLGCVGYLVTISTILALIGTAVLVVIYGTALVVECLTNRRQRCSAVTDRALARWDRDLGRVGDDMQTRREI